MVLVAFWMSSIPELYESLELRCLIFVGNMKCQTGTQNNFSNPLFNHPDEDRGN